MREMKDSGIEWIGEMPENWKVKRLRFLCDITTGNKDTINKESNGQYPFFVRSPIIENINSYSFDGEGILTAGDGVGAGKVFHHYVGKFDYHQRVYNLHNYNGVYGRYLFYYMRENFIKEIEKGNAKSTVDSIRLPMLKNFPILCFDEALQKKIATHLDERVAHIDNIISKTKESIEEYKKYKQSVITEAVTKGLDKNVKMKDSGIEWIGEIPEGWSVASLKKYVNIRNGREINLEMEDVGDAIPVYGSGGIFKFTDDILFKGPSVLFGRKGTIGRPLYVEGDFWTVDTMYYTSFQNNCVAKFCYYMLQSFPWDTIATKTALPSVAGVNVANSKFAFPALTTQKSIVDFLDEKVALIDSTISKKEILLIELEAYKKSLIYEVVTGKKEIN